MIDSEVVKAAQLGDREAFGMLIEHYQNMIFRLCYQMTDSIQDAEDLTHDAFVEAYLKLHQLRELERFEPWIRTLTLNLCRMWYREKGDKNISALPAQQNQDEDTIYAQVTYGLSRLSISHRMVLTLHYWEGLSYEEIARFLEIPIGTVMSRLHRARNELKKLMETMKDEEIPMIPDEEFQQEIEAEIDMLLKIFGNNPDAMERLSIILKSSPERFKEIIRQADDATLNRFALLLWWLKHPAVQVVLEAALSSDIELRVCAVDVLKRWTRHWMSRYASAPPHSMHFLLDKLISSRARPEDKTELLIELLEECVKGSTGPLLTCVLLCYPEVAFPILLERYWNMSSVEELHHHSHILHALCRTGTLFGEVLLEHLVNGHIRQQTLALTGLEALTKALNLPQFRDASGEDLLMGARFTEGIGPPLKEHRDPAILKQIVERVAGFLAHARADMRDPAIRILGSMQAHDHLSQIKEYVQHDEPSTRIAAIIALGQIGNASCIQVLIEAAQKGDITERRIAIEIMGGLHAQDAEPLLAQLADDKNSQIRQAAVFALGEMESKSAQAKLKEFSKSQDKAVARAAAKTLHAKQKPRIEMDEKRPRRIGREVSPPFFISTEAAIRALPEIRDYEEDELTRIIAQVCYDYSTTRRHLVMDRRYSLMNRSGGIYQLTELGKAVWRVEHFIVENYLRS